MSGFLLRQAIFQKFREAYGNDSSKQQAQKMLNASMAGAALVAVADGNACLAEGAEASNVISVLEILQVTNPRTGVSLYVDYVDRATKAEDERSKLRGIVSELANDEDERSMLIEICVAISRADGRVVEDEHLEINRITSCLGLERQAQRES